MMVHLWYPEMFDLHHLVSVKRSLEVECITSGAFGAGQLITLAICTIRERHANCHHPFQTGR